ncbi:Iron hydrogenase 1 [Tritrichomonas foetus]|uniref:Iron hydrogenase 1 n=1 Tax=Tritrichomonas foetus TaxID=1144522 RepID=A0A1J4JF13_9EUKA|nr:Iron hydrogenase 1 [Tritrichomonas foetus]|eukprot:OHS96235.1 Iron hydrogenase 1 [Tritrichomonas foetus]
MISQKMLSSCLSRNITVTVNGRNIEANKGETIMQLCDRIHVKIPRLCHHPNIPPKASCRVCLVECDKKWLAPSCVTEVWDGLTIDTQSKAVLEAVKGKLTMLLSTHDERCTSCVSNNKCSFRDMVYRYGVECKKREPPAPAIVDKTTNSIQLDLAKCLLCGRCVRACEHITGLNAIQFARRADNMTVEPAAGRTLVQTNCVQCGQCALYCPAGAITEKSQAREVLHDIRNHVDKIMVAIVSPSVKINIAEEMGLPEGTDCTGKIISMLKGLGFDLVFDGALGDDLMVYEESKELLNYLKETKETNTDENKKRLPLFSSNCPAFVNYIEQTRPDLIKNLSTCRSPQAMISSLVKNLLAKNWTGLTLYPEDFYCLTISSCLARKDEIERAGLVTLSGVKETDAAITTREFAQICRLNNTKFHSLKDDSQFDSIYGSGSGSAALLPTTGGLAEAVIRVISNGKLHNVEFKELQGTDNVGIAEVVIENQSFKVAVVSGLRCACELIARIESGDAQVKDVKYVEVLSCPGGCASGGGSPKFEDPKVMDRRIIALHNVDEHAKLKQSDENPIVLKLLKGDLSNTKLVHQLLHTSFKPRGK